MVELMMGIYNKNELNQDVIVGYMCRENRCNNFYYLPDIYYMVKRGLIKNVSIVNTQTGTTLRGTNGLKLGSLPKKYVWEIM